MPIKYMNFWELLLNKYLYQSPTHAFSYCLHNKTSTSPQRCSRKSYNRHDKTSTCPRRFPRKSRLWKHIQHSQCLYCAVMLLYKSHKWITEAHSKLTYTTFLVAVYNFLNLCARSQTVQCLWTKIQEEIACVLHQSFTCCITLGKLILIFMPLTFHLWNRVITLCFWQVTYKDSLNWGSEMAQLDKGTCLTIWVQSPGLI